MPTPGEQRALIFLAAVAALGVAARGWQSHRSATAPVVASDPAGLARQIEAVDSAIASGGARRGRGRGLQPAGRAEPTSAQTRADPTDRRVRSAAGAPAVVRVPAVPAVPAAPAAPAAAEPPDNRAKYLARWARADSLRSAINARQARLTPRPAARAPRAGPSAPVDLDVATAEEIGAVPVIGAALARRIVADRIGHGPFGSADELQRVRGVSASLARRMLPYVTFSRSPVTSGRVEEPRKQSSPRRRRKQP